MEENKKFEELLTELENIVKELEAVEGVFRVRVVK